MILLKAKNIIAPAGRGSVLILALLLTSSATIRLIASAGGVLAQDGQLPNTPMVAAASPAEKAQNAGSDRIIDATAPHMATTERSEIKNLITALSERETLVSERERQLEMRLRALAVADAEIEKRLTALTETEATLRATLSLADEASEKDILRLTSVYESMKPKDAALLFEQMEPNFAAGFLGRMRPDVAAEVLSGLSPQVAYSISVILAGRNANVPKT